MQINLAGKKVSKLLKVGGGRETITESVEIEFTSETNFAFTGKYSYLYISDNYDGDRENNREFIGSGTYQVTSRNPEKKETVVKLLFNKFSKKEEENQEDIPNLITVAHFFEVYGTDIYFEDKKIFENLQEDNLFANIWTDEIDMLVRSGIPNEEAYIRVYDYFQSIADNHTYKYSYSYCVVDDLIYEIFQKCYPDKTNHLYNVFLWVKDYFGDQDFTVHDLCVMWKEAGFKLKNFLKKNNLEAFADEIRQQVYDLYDNSVPEELEI